MHMTAPRMADVFALPVSPDYLWTSPKECRAAARAINNHDALCEALALAGDVLAEMVKRGVIGTDMDVASNYHIGEDVMPTISAVLAAARSET